MERGWGDEIMEKTEMRVKLTICVYAGCAGNRKLFHTHLSMFHVAPTGEVGDGRRWTQNIIEKEMVLCLKNMTTYLM